ncbi:MAG: peptidase M4 [Candidatus Bathyarchaeota archaeon]|nr:peptidase M4 [Candidatus Bathyarchaeota archaeon]
MPLLILIIGLLLLVGVFLISLTPIFSPLEPVDDIQEAKDLAEQYLTRNYPFLEVEEIMEFSNNFYIIAKETATENSALELLIDRYSGRVYLEPGPSMMWNTKYGHHQMHTNPTVLMPIDSDSAVMIAQDWLNRNTAGYRVEETAVFYGYYTMDFAEKEQIFGMLSVNGYSGEVWYHSWHGDFISMEEYD